MIQSSFRGAVAPLSRSEPAGPVRVDDCVNVEQAGSGTANVRRVAESLCEAAFANQVDEELQGHMSREADMCLEAKERMMEAETDEAFEVAMRRVKFLCDD